MARIARVVAVGMAHHVTQRGINREAVFPSDAARLVYLSLLRENAKRHHLRIAGYCLMTNHVHLLVVPDREDALARTLRGTHGRFAQYANAALGRSGHFWQNRFFSCPVEDRAVAKVLSYIELNPVRAGLAAVPAAFAWSSAAVHLGMQRDQTGMLDLDWWRQRWTEDEWSFILRSRVAPEAIRQATHTGRPFGSEEFVADLARRLGRKLDRGKGGRPKKRSLAA